MSIRAPWTAPILRTRAFLGLGLGRPSAWTTAQHEAIPRTRPPFCMGTGMCMSRVRTPRIARRSYASVSAAQLQFGQPVHETHPHILKAGELTPGITAQEYADRRAALALKLPENGIAVLSAADIKYRSGVVFYPYRQESNFFYLTGFTEPQSMAVIQRTGPNLGDYLFHLYARPKDPVAEQWSGPWSGLQAAEDVFNADKTGDIKMAESLLKPLLNGASKIYTDIELTKAGQPTRFGSLLRATAPSIATAPLQPLINTLRMIKSKAETANMRHAGRVSGRGIAEAMRRPWTGEKDLHSFLDYSFTSDGCDGPSYVPVVAGGSRANLIHYVLNNAPLSRDEFVLVDAGGEYGGYATDITRTWPARGKFGPAQRDLYEAVLAVQRAGVALCRASAKLSLDDIHRSTEAGLREQLSALGFNLSGYDALSTLFPHHVGHYVGLDIHDCPGFSRSVPLRPGYVVTVEPGVYVPDDERWPVHFRGMGVRIEDTVCVDEDSPLVLSTEAPKEVVDLEALRTD